MTRDHRTPVEARVRRRRRRLLVAVAAYVVVIVVPGAMVGRALSAQVAGPLPAPVARLTPAAPPSTGAPPGTVPTRPARGSAAPPATPAPAPDALARWAQTLEGRTGIPAVALAAYGRAQLGLQGTDPGCGLTWTTLAGIGWVESDHGRYAGAVLGADGRSTPPIVGVALAGRAGLALVPDTDDGALDGDVVHDRAVGPLQFIPTTWQAWEGDGDGDGVADPFDIDDAAWAAGRYLCAAGGDLASAAGWAGAVYAYNHSDRYVDMVRSAADQYAAWSATP